MGNESLDALFGATPHFRQPPPLGCAVDCQKLQARVMLCPPADEDWEASCKLIASSTYKIDDFASSCRHGPFSLAIGSSRRRVLPSRTPSSLEYLGHGSAELGNSAGRATRCFLVASVSWWQGFPDFSRPALSAFVICATSRRQRR